MPSPRHMWSDGIRHDIRFEPAIAATMPLRDAIQRRVSSVQDEELFWLRLMNDWYRVQLDHPRSRAAGA